MNKFIRLYNQNRVFIWMIVIAIIILIIAIQALNQIAIKNVKNVNKNNTIAEEEYKDNLNINVLIEDEKVEEDTELIIDQFIRYCNAKEVEKAYNLLSDDCKNELFPTVNDFINNYYYKLFNTKKLYSKEVSYEKTYRIKYYEDIMATGITNDNIIEDYYTIQTKNNITKLNISNYIKEVNINKQKNLNELKINVIEKQVYTEYEEYKIEFTNLTEKVILLDSKESTKTIYLLGDKNIKLYCLSHDILKDELIIEPKTTKSITIKFNKNYRISNNISTQIVFSDIIFDYEEYKKLDKKSEYKYRGSITI